MLEFLPNLSGNLTCVQKFYAKIDYLHEFIAFTFFTRKPKNAACAVVESDESLYFYSRFELFIVLREICRFSLL